MQMDFNNKKNKTGMVKTREWWIKKTIFSIQVYMKIFSYTKYWVLHLKKKQKKKKQKKKKNKIHSKKIFQATLTLLLIQLIAFCFLWFCWRVEREKGGSVQFKKKKKIKKSKQKIKDSIKNIYYYYYYIIINTLTI